MTVVYLLEHVTERDDHENVKFIGVFSSERQAISARDSLRDVEGFRNHRDGFSINAHKIGVINWAEGFIDHE